MSGFSSRTPASIKHERNIGLRLRELYGCDTTNFGQEQVPSIFRTYLWQHGDKTFLRWIPDLLVARPAFRLLGRSWIWLIDAKWSEYENTPNWDLEKASHDAHREQLKAFGLPIVYVWRDYSCSYVEDLTDDIMWTGPKTGNGSGTDYWLFRKTVTRMFDSVFGDPVSLINASEDGAEKKPKPSIFITRKNNL